MGRAPCRRLSCNSDARLIPPGQWRSANSSNRERAKNWPALVRATGISVLDPSRSPIAALPTIAAALDSAWAAVDNDEVEVPGQVRNGVVVLDGPTRLPEGARVVVSYGAKPRIRTAPVRRPVTLPIFPYNGPPDIELTNDRIAEVLDIEDASA